MGDKNYRYSNSARPWIEPTSSFIATDRCASLFALYDVRPACPQLASAAELYHYTHVTANHAQRMLRRVFRHLDVRYRSTPAWPTELCAVLKLFPSTFPGLAESQC